MNLAVRNTNKRTETQRQSEEKEEEGGERGGRARKETVRLPHLVSKDKFQLNI